MPDATVLVSLPGLRAQDLERMPTLKQVATRGDVRPLIPSFPCVTLPVQANLTTGVSPAQHGVIANGFYYREKGDVEMWTAWNDCIQAPQIWDLLHQRDPELTSLLWFPMFAKGAGADFIATPAPIHNPDGSESLWCYTKPTELYGELRDTFGHFPLMNFWGPIASLKSSDWIVDSAVHTARKHQPRFSYIYLPHLDYAAQKTGPDSEEALAAVEELDGALERLVAGYDDAGLGEIHWLFASEYVINEVSEVVYPNRILRQAGLLGLREENGREHLVPGESRAWAMVDHQLAHVFVRDEKDIQHTADLFRDQPFVEGVYTGPERRQVNLDHPRAGEIVLVSRPEAWFAYYWWQEDEKAPDFARTVDIHRKPGYDPVELFIEMPGKTTPLDATLVKGSHGYPADVPQRQGVLVSSAPLERNEYRDLDVTPLVLSNFG
jgi:predicted AlkP superfamily pyrophosphatase or phosphodiesterase